MNVGLQFDYFITREFMFAWIFYIRIRSSWFINAFCRAKHPRLVKLPNSKAPKQKTIILPWRTKKPKRAITDYPSWKWIPAVQRLECSWARTWCWRRSWRSFVSAGWGRPLARKSSRRSPSRWTSGRLRRKASRCCPAERSGARVGRTARTWARRRWKSTSWRSSESSCSPWTS